MSRRLPLSRLRSPLSVFWIAGVLLLATIAWPRTVWRRKRGPRLMSRRESLSEKYQRQFREAEGAHTDYHEAA